MRTRSTLKCSTRSESRWITSVLRLVHPIPPLFGRQLSRSPRSLGTISVASRRSSRNFRRPCSIQSSIQTNSSNTVCNRQRVYCFMVLLVPVRPCSPRPLRVKARRTSSLSRSELNTWRSSTLLTYTSGTGIAYHVVR
jgi:hypothetical protein